MGKRGNERVGGGGGEGDNREIKRMRSHKRRWLHHDTPTVYTISEDIQLRPIAFPLLVTITIMRWEVMNMAESQEGVL